MAELTRGTVTDRPWGSTLSATANRLRSGQLVLHGADGRRYAIAFDNGTVIGATSPMPADSVARIALTSHLVMSSQVAGLAARIAAEPARDEIAVLAELARLSPEQAEGLRGKLVLQRAARTFAVDRGEFVVDDEISIATSPMHGIDIRAVVLMGARLNLSQERLADELRALAPVLALLADAGDLGRYGITTDDQRVIDVLRRGTSMPELEALLRDVDPRELQSLIYALAACGALRIGAAPRTTATTATPRTTSTTVPPSTRPTTQPPRPVSASQPPRTTTPSQPPRTTTPSQLPRTQTEPVVARVPTIPRTATPTLSPPITPARSSSTTAGPPRAPTEWPAASRTTTARRTALAMREAEVLVASRAAMIDRHVDHFTLLGVPMDAHDDAIRAAHAKLARQLHPDRLAEIGLIDDSGLVVKVLAALGDALAVLVDPTTRARYVAALRIGGDLPGPAAPRQDDHRAALEAMQRGDQALRADNIAKAVIELELACQLAPNDVDCQGLLAWAKFCAATNKAAIAVDTRRVLDRVIQKSDKPQIARFYLGRVERMLGREREALRHFHEVLELVPNHAEAKSEVRVLEARIAAADKR